ncbi:pyridoxamine 5'-phosphate oxidase family protein [Streptomyces malaysiensis subsp. malaysiensis]|uniref:pyridoxamine 5'-phosphate oxidase family protein n=1 Tax=Streptomyces malaysiensis TaxID=92644 RepID=UPI000BFB8467|nr:pyridoxamine 5'-phosphate oxidase family protein [Streptomyces malaysiensis]ATL88126.1 pyridoxamine 5'-phosphate oxidase-related, FMN-binding [Streptomyces malaysiensis]QDL68551.1 pyridoxamine 5'-phosphate oxidase family protein [Streptomyces malaysiensis]
MSKPEPTVAEIETEIVEMLRAEELSSLATIDADGFPSSARMHLAGDGLLVYMHTFKNTRKHVHIQHNPNVGYDIAHLPPDGFYGRFTTRSLQVQGTATVVTDMDEIQHASKISLNQFPWAADTSLFNNIKPPDQGMQVFYRIQPVRGMWADARVSLAYRALLEFSEDGKSIAQVSNYKPATAPPS